jgi:hypothetical protein
VERGSVRHKSAEKFKQWVAQAMDGTVLKGFILCGEEQAHCLRIIVKTESSNQSPSQWIYWPPKLPPAACGLLRTLSPGPVDHSIFPFPSSLPQGGLLLSRIWKCRDWHSECWVPSVLSLQQISVLFMFPALSDTLGDPLAWMLSECTNWEAFGSSGTCQAHRLQSFLGPAVALEIQRRESAKVNAALKLTTDSWLAWPSACIQHQAEQCCHCVAICFLLS